MYISQLSVSKSLLSLTLILFLGTYLEHSIAVAQTGNHFYLAKNGITVKCPNADIGESGTVNGITYTKRTADEI